MPYAAHGFANLAEAPLLSAITNSSTSIVVAAGMGALFSATPFEAKIEQFSNDICTKREFVQVTARSGDVLTVTRAYEPCPASNAATTQTQTALAFDDGAILSNIHSATRIKETEAEAIRLETDKLDKTTARKCLFDRGYHPLQGIAET